MSCVYKTDESDWDSGSASSQSSSSKRMASPGLEDQNSSNSSAKEQDEGDSPDAPVPSQSIIANKTSKSSPPVHRPQPSARKMVFQMKETVEGKVLFAI